MITAAIEPFFTFKIVIIDELCKSDLDCFFCSDCNMDVIVITIIHKSEDVIAFIDDSCFACVLVDDFQCVIFYVHNAPLRASVPTRDANIFLNVYYTRKNRSCKYRYAERMVFCLFFYPPPYSVFSNLFIDTSYAVLLSYEPSSNPFWYSLDWIRPESSTLSPTTKDSAYLAFLPQAMQGI